MNKTRNFDRIGDLVKEWVSVTFRCDIELGARLTLVVSDFSLTSNYIARRIKKKNKTY